MDRAEVRAARGKLKEKMELARLKDQKAQEEFLKRQATETDYEDEDRHGVRTRSDDDGDQDDDEEGDQLITEIDLGEINKMSPEELSALHLRVLGRKPTRGAKRETVIGNIAGQVQANFEAAASQTEGEE